MTDEAKKRTDYNRELQYRIGRRTPGWPNGKPKKSVAEAIARQKEFERNYGPTAIDEWQEAGIIKDATERVAIELYYGVNGQTPPTLKEIGKELRISKQRVSQIIKQVLERRQKQE